MKFEIEIIDERAAEAMFEWLKTWEGVVDGNFLNADVADVGIVMEQENPIVIIHSVRKLNN